VDVLSHITRNRKAFCVLRRAHHQTGRASATSPPSTSGHRSEEYSHRLLACTEVLFTAGTARGTVSGPAVLREA